MASFAVAPQSNYTTKLKQKATVQKMARTKKTEKEPNGFNNFNSTQKVAPAARSSLNQSSKKKPGRKNLSGLRNKLRDETHESLESTQQMRALTLFDDVDSIDSEEKRHDQALLMEESLDLLCEDMIYKVMAKQIRKSVVADAVHSINSRISSKQAMKLVQKRMIKSITKKMVTEIIQESTDAIYQFEDDSITLADFVLRLVLKQEIRSTFNECKRQAKKQNK